MNSHRLPPLSRTLSVLILSLATVAAGGEPLFRHTGAGGDTSRSHSEAVVRTATIAFDPEDIFSRGPRGRPSEHLVLNLFPGVTLEATLEWAESAGPGASSWYGVVSREGSRDDSSLVVFTAAGDMVVGTVLHEGRRYVVTRVSEEVAGIAEIDPRQLPDIDERSPRRDERDVIPYEGDREPPWSDRKIPLDDGSVIDVLVLWSDVSYQQAAGNVLTYFTEMFGFNPGLGWVMSNLGVLDVFIEQVVVPHAIAVGNQVLINSGVQTKLNLVHTESVKFTTSGNLEIDVDQLSDPGDGVVDHVHALREKHAADLVVMVTDREDPLWCGMADAIPMTVAWAWESRAFAVVAPPCLVGSFTFIHEVAHLLAARHDWYVDATNGQPFTYNHGYTYLPASVGLMTIMAYRDECEDKGGFLCMRVPYFSLGVAPFGEPIGSSQAADNATALNATAYTAANYRASYCRTHPCP